MRRVVAAAVLVLTAAFVTGCGGDDGPGSEPTSESPAPEDVTTDAASVAKGLQAIKAIAVQIEAAVSNDAAATALDARIEPIWATIEGTVKGNDPDIYITLEDAFAVLEDASSSSDATKAAAGTQSVSEAVADYLAKHPGS